MMHRKQVPVFGKEAFFSRIGSGPRPWLPDYLLMYCSQWQGAVRDPDLMLIPVDDHLVHRGDGVFEVMRCVQGRIYALDAHLKRLDRSSEAIALALPEGAPPLRDLLPTLTAMGGERDCLIRVMVSRGPGSFSVNPFDCPESRLYVIVYRYHPLAAEDYRRGVRIITSSVPAKGPFFANIKSCAYLPNVLMKMEAVKSGHPYAVGLDEEGFLTEGPTENVAVLTEDGILRFPWFHRTLAGITATRVFALAEGLAARKGLAGVQFSSITRQEAYRAREVFLMGTSMNVLPVVEYDGNKIGEGTPGPLFAELSRLLWEDMTLNEAVLSPVDWEGVGSSAPGGAGQKGSPLGHDGVQSR